LELNEHLYRTPRSVEPLVQGVLRIVEIDERKSVESEAFLALPD
jgi:hypothetical protein